MRQNLVTLRNHVVGPLRLLDSWRQDLTDAAATGDPDLARKAVAPERLEHLRQSVAELVAAFDELQESVLAAAFAATPGTPIRVGYEATPEDIERVNAAAESLILKPRSAGHTVPFDAGDNPGPALEPAPKSLRIPTLRPDIRVQMYRCCMPDCPGYPYQASEVRHPCGQSLDENKRFREDARAWRDRPALVSDESNLSSDPFNRDDDSFNDDKWGNT